MLLGDLDRDEVAVDGEVDAGVLDAGDVGENLERLVGLCAFFGELGGVVEERVRRVVEGEDASVLACIVGTDDAPTRRDNDITRPSSSPPCFSPPFFFARPASTRPRFPSSSFPPHQNTRLLRDGKERNRGK